MAEPSSDVQSDESIAQVNVYENLDNSDGEDIYGDRLSVPSISTSAQTIRFKFPKSAGASAYLCTVFTVCFQRARFKGDRGEILD